ARRLLRRAPAEKIENHNSARRREKGYKTIIEMEIVWEAVHQNDRRFGARVFSRIDAELSSMHRVFSELHLLQPAVVEFLSTYRPRYLQLLYKGATPARF